MATHKSFIIIILIIITIIIIIISTTSSADNDDDNEKLSVLDYKRHTHIHATQCVELLGCRFFAVNHVAQCHERYARVRAHAVVQRQDFLAPPAVVHMDGIRGERHVASSYRHHDASLWGKL